MILIFVSIYMYISVWGYLFQLGFYAAECVISESFWAYFLNEYYAFCCIYREINEHAHKKGIPIKKQRKSKHCRLVNHWSVFFFLFTSLHYLFSPTLLKQSFISGPNMLWNIHKYRPWVFLFFFFFFLFLSESYRNENNHRLGL